MYSDSHSLITASHRQDGLRTLNWLRVWMSCWTFKRIQERYTVLLKLRWWRRCHTSQFKEKKTTTTKPPACHVQDLIWSCGQWLSVKLLPLQSLICCKVTNTFPSPAYEPRIHTERSYSQRHFQRSLTGSWGNLLQAFIFKKTTTQKQDPAGICPSKPNKEGKKALWMTDLCLEANKPHLHYTH